MHNCETEDVLELAARREASAARDDLWLVVLVLLACVGAATALVVL